MTLPDLLKAYVNHDVVNEELPSSFVKLCLEQSLHTLLYPVTNNKKYMGYYIAWVMKQEQFNALQNEITSILGSAQIKHIYFKGSVLSNLYDDPSVRTRGDIDLFVGPTDFSKAKGIFLENGFVDESTYDDSMHHIAYRKNGMEVELHFNLLDNDVDAAWRKVFYEPFQHSVSTTDYAYQLDATYHFLYCLMHFAQHLRIGAGIRYILDFYYMLEKTMIDFDLLHNLLKKNHLEVLYANIINTIRFLTEKDYDSSIQSKDIQFFIDYMLLYGIHGRWNNETTISTTRHKHKVRYALTRAFLIDKNYRLAQFPKMGCHWYLYPICLLCQLFYLATHKIPAFLRCVFGENKNKKLYKDLGV